MTRSIIRQDATEQDRASDERFLGRHSRAAFLRQAAALALGGMGAIGRQSVSEGSEAASSTQSPGTTRRQPRGGRGTAAKRWDVVTIGNLSRNRYWGESDSKAMRSAICTCTVIQGEGFRLVVDPSLRSAEEMAKELDRRCGLKIGDVDTVFITHEHGDHWYGLAHFRKARWLAGAAVAAELNKEGKLSNRVETAGGTICGAVEVIATPGHNPSHHSLRFDCDGQSVVVAGDAVATRDFWLERRGYFNCVDFGLSARSMNKLSSMADIVVPGHDNFFLNLDTDSQPGNSP